MSCPILIGIGLQTDHVSLVSRCDGELGPHHLPVSSSAGGQSQSLKCCRRTTAVLFDEKQSDQRYKNRVAYVVAHELAHQWFGNLVTMDWWSELWLVSANAVVPDLSAVCLKKSCRTKDSRPGSVGSPLTTCILVSDHYCNISNHR